VIEQFELPRLRALPKEVRIFAGLVMLVLAVGYAHAIAYVYVTTRIVPKGIEERYRGGEQTTPPPSATGTAVDTSDITTRSADTPIAQPNSEQAKTVTGEMQFEKTFPEMLNIIHTHILTMSVIFAISGLITLLTGVFRPGFRKLIVIEPFVGILVTFAGLWATRYLGKGFSWLVSLSGAMMALAFAAQCVAVMRELFGRSQSGARIE
jgi:hypothetical protein